MGVQKKVQGVINRNDYNNLIDFVGGESAFTSMFDNDLQMNNPSGGLVVWTPDGTKRYRIRVNNSGNLVSELVV